MAQYTILQYTERAMYQPLASGEEKSILNTGDFVGATGLFRNLVPGYNNNFAKNTLKLSYGANIKKLWKPTNPDVECEIHIVYFNDVIKDIQPTTCFKKLKTYLAAKKQVKADFQKMKDYILQSQNII